MANQDRHTQTEREFYQDREGNTYGRVSQQRSLDENQIERDNDNTANGLLIGIILTSLVGLGAGLYYLSQRTNQPATPIAVPTSSPNVTTSPTPQPQRTIIQRERTIERTPAIVPVPQATTTVTPSPSPNINIQQSGPTTAPAPDSPDINITVPPSPAPSPTAPSSRTTPSPATSPQSNITPEASPNPTDATPSSAAPETLPDATPNQSGNDSSPTNANDSNP